MHDVCEVSVDRRDSRRPAEKRQIRLDEQEADHRIARLDGGSYFQHAMHVITLRWGKITAIDVFEDSQAVARALQAQAAVGLAEAIAEPILS